MSTAKSSAEHILDKTQVKLVKYIGPLDKQLDAIKDDAKKKTAQVWSAYKAAKLAGKYHDKSATKLFVAAVWAEANLKSAPIKAKKYDLQVKILKTSCSELGEKVQKDAEAAAKKPKKVAPKKKSKKPQKVFNKTALLKSAIALGLKSTIAAKMTEEELFDFINEKVTA